MKQRLCLILLLMFTSLCIHAQQGLNVAPLFQGKIVPHGDLIDVRAKGRAISKYKLDYYHSIRFKASEQQRATVFELVERDHKNAIGAEQTMKKGTFTLILALPAQGALHKYLCYLTQQRGRTLTITLVYMEGKVSSITELKKLIQ